MDFQELLEQADYNAAVTQTDAKYKDGIKRYSSKLPPPKKMSKANVQSDNIRRFLEKRKAEEAAKVAESKKEKERLLALRAQNSKNNKKAKIMASRTKDNDFSRIKLTEDEKEALKRREKEIIRKNLADKVERMKARIEMEEKEKLLPKKRKRKSKNGDVVGYMIDQDDPQNEYNESNTNIKSIDSYQPQKEKVRKPKPPPPPPAMSFTELLKIAEKRQVQPIEIVVKKKEEAKLMTKREKKVMEEEQARLKRKQERLLQQKSGLSKPSNSAQVSSGIKKNTLEKEEKKKPVVIHVKSEQDAKFKIPKSSVTITKEVTSNKHKDVSPTINSKSKSNSNSLNKPLKNPPPTEQKKTTKPKDDIGSSIKGGEIKKKIALPKKNGLKSNPVQMAPKKQVNPVLDREDVNADIEKKIQERMIKEREKIEKEIEERIAAKFAQFQNMQSKVTEKVPEVPKRVKKEPVVENKTVKKITEKPQSGFYKKDMERMIALRKEAIEKSTLKPKMPEKTFHKNPYLDPPRRLLEPQRPLRPPMKRRIESDDEDDEDDMSDFIDDGTSQNDEDYSKYIKEIFGYDRNRYLDDDDDDIMESTYEQQMKEEVKSARLGYLEDLEEERLEMERRKKKKVKK